MQGYRVLDQRVLQGYARLCKPAQGYARIFENIFCKGTKCGEAHKFQGPSSKKHQRPSSNRPKRGAPREKFGADLCRGAAEARKMTNYPKLCAAICGYLRIFAGLAKFSRGNPGLEFEVQGSKSHGYPPRYLAGCEGLVRFCPVLPGFARFFYRGAPQGGKLQALKHQAP